jgi:hypothetical protein
VFLVQQCFGSKKTSEVFCSERRTLVMFSRHDN